MNENRSDHQKWEQIKYHNEKIYYNIELFSKLTLAICGGTAYIVVNHANINAGLIYSLLRMSSFLQLSIGIYASLAIFMHTLSKIRRFPSSSDSLIQKISDNKIIVKAIFWLEPWSIVFIFLVSIYLSMSFSDISLKIVSP
jgi:ABC-type multidrug transport system fused ATPase/permease subunit